MKLNLVECFFHLPLLNFVVDVSCDAACEGLLSLYSACVKVSLYPTLCLKSLPFHYIVCYIYRPPFYLCPNSECIHLSKLLRPQKFHSGPIKAESIACTLLSASNLTIQCPMFLKCLLYDLQLSIVMQHDDD